MVATSAFETDPALEKGPKYAGKHPTGYVYFNTDAHFWFDCKHIGGFKRKKAAAAVAANPTPTAISQAVRRTAMSSIDNNANDTNNVENDEKDNSTNTPVNSCPLLSSTTMNIVARVIKAVHHSLTPKYSLTMILDRGANHNMSGNKRLFSKF